MRKKRKEKKGLPRYHAAKLDFNYKEKVKLSSRTRNIKKDIKEIQNKTRRKISEFKVF